MHQTTDLVVLDQWLRSLQGSDMVTCLVAKLPT